MKDHGKDSRKQVAHRTVIFGASSLGALALQHLPEGVSPIAFCDNDLRKQEATFNGLPVISPVALNHNDQIVVASQHDIAIADQLWQLGFREFQLFNPATGQRFCDYRLPPFNSHRNPKQICLIVENHSASNTLALSRNTPSAPGSVVVADRTSPNDDFFEAVLSSSTVIWTHDGQALNDQFNVQLFHAFPLKTLGLLNPNDPAAEHKSAHWKTYDRIASYSPLYNELMNRCFTIDESRVSITGLPRNDLLFREHARALLATTLSQDVTGPQVLLMPTFRDSGTGEINGHPGQMIAFINTILTDPYLSDQLTQRHARIVMKLHPYEESCLRRYVDVDKLNHVEVLPETRLLEHGIDLYDIAGAFDLLITDYSSIYFDFLLLDRPMIFIPIDLAEYERTRGLLLSPYQEWTPGPKCLTIDDLRNHLISNIDGSDPYRDHRSRITKVAHSYRDNQSSKRVWRMVSDLIDADSKV